jgi:hypothetical protein
VNNRLRRTAAWAARDFGEVAEVVQLSRRLAAELPGAESAAVG